MRPNRFESLTHGQRRESDTPSAAKPAYFSAFQAWLLQFLTVKPWGVVMIRFALLIAVFVAAQFIFLSHAQASEAELTLCTKWAQNNESKDVVSTFKCSINGKSYATGLGFCTTEKSQSTVEEMISDIKVTRLFCKPEWSKNAFECSRDEDSETQACAKEFNQGVAAF